MFLGCWGDNSLVKCFCPSIGFLVWILTACVKRVGQHMSVHVLNSSAGRRGPLNLMDSQPSP